MIDEYNRYAEANGLPGWDVLDEDQRTVVRHEWDAMLARLASAEMRLRRQAFDSARGYIAREDTEELDFR